MKTVFVQPRLYWHVRIFYWDARAFHNRRDTTASDAAPYRYEVVVIHNLMILLLLSIARMLES